MNETLKTIQQRRSVKKYKSDAVPKALLEQIAQAGIQAASGLNKQSPIVLVITDKAIRDKLSKLNAGKDPFFRSDPFYGAPAVLVVLADKSVPTYIYDGSLVMGNMLLAAQALGLGACWIHRAKETFEMEEGKEILRQIGLDGEYEGIGNCIVGYPDTVPEEKPRKENRIYYI
ncbi:MAG: nitroreductase [Clostridia bacterium]|nr:nitroreductase [Clostridia bacterium]